MRANILLKLISVSSILSVILMIIFSLVSLNNQDPDEKKVVNFCRNIREDRKKECIESTLLQSCVLFDSNFKTCQEFGQMIMNNH